MSANPLPVVRLRVTAVMGGRYRMSWADRASRTGDFNAPDGLVTADGREFPADSDRARERLPQPVTDDEEIGLLETQLASTVN